MAQISIISDDKTVVKDGAGIGGLTLSSIPADVWAVQWNTTTSKGTVEKRDWSITEITELGVYQACIDEYDDIASKISSETTISKELEFKGQRDSLLYSSDWTQLADSPLSSTKKAEWVTYRQALRDLPASTSDYDNVTWPTQPS